MVNFHVGQKVVCVCAFYDGGAYLNSWPAHVVVGGIYTVRDVDSRIPNLLCLRLEEYLAPHVHPWEIPFLAEHFQPVIERKTDISIFTKMLSPTPRERELA